MVFRVHAFERESYTPQTMRKYLRNTDVHTLFEQHCWTKLLLQSMRNQFDYFHVNVHVVLYFFGGNIPRFANNNLNVTNFQNQELFETAYAGFKR